MPAGIANYNGLNIAKHYPELAVIVTAKTAELRATGDPIDDARAVKLEKAFVTLDGEFLAIAADWAVKGTEILRRRERDSRVRPDTLGGGGPRLGDFLFAEAIPQAPGSVGVANEDKLDDNVPWWPTNEVGSSTQADEGRVLFGAFFQPGPRTPPNPAEFQEHALFAPGPGAGAGLGHVSNPIIGKHFIRDSYYEINAGWAVEMNAALSKFVNELP